MFIGLFPLGDQRFEHKEDDGRLGQGKLKGDGKKRKTQSHARIPESNPVEFKSLWRGLKPIAP